MLELNSKNGGDDNYDGGEDRDVNAIEAQRQKLENMFGGGTQSSSSSSSSSLKASDSDASRKSRKANQILPVSELIERYLLIDDNGLPKVTKKARTSSDDQGSHTATSTKILPLTAIGRERLQTEILLLESLASNDDAIDELWNLWYHGRGPQAYTELMKTEEYVSLGVQTSVSVNKYWIQAEHQLQQLIQEHGIYWVEPINRLATLYYLQQRFDDSFKLCQIVLKLKPWHFGALSGIVMVCQRLLDSENMIHYAKQRMPPLLLEENQEGDTVGEELRPSLAERLRKSRRAWSERMVSYARIQLEASSSGGSSSSSSIGKTRREEDEGRGGMNGQEDETSWQ